MPCQRRTRRRVAEHLVDHHRQMVSSRTIVRPQLARSELDRLSSGRPQGSFLLAPKDERDQPLAARIGQQPDQPRRESIGYKHTSSLPAARAPDIGPPQAQGSLAPKWPGGPPSEGGRAPQRAERRRNFSGLCPPSPASPGNSLPRLLIGGTTDSSSISGPSWLVEPGEKGLCHGSKAAPFYRST